MKKRLATVALAAFVAVGALHAIGAPAANATEAPATVEVYWAMPDGGTPENVTWPQAYAPDGATEPGVCYQIDTYLEEEAPLFTADGVLQLGEDYQTEDQRGAISWRFECVPPMPEEVTVKHEGEPVVDCKALVAIYTDIFTKSQWKLVGLEWVESDPIVWTETKQIPVAEYDPNACPPIYVPPVELDLCPNIDGLQETIPEGYELSNEMCVIADTPTPGPSEEPTPTEPPVAQPTEKPTPVTPDIKPVAVTQDSAPAELAETGFDMAAAIVIMSLLIAAGLAAVAVNTLRRKKTIR